MKPNNEYTSPEQRFFYPVNHEIEHHESLDTTDLPKVEVIHGRPKFVIVEDETGEHPRERHSLSGANIAQGTVIKSLEVYNTKKEIPHWATVEEVRAIGRVVFYEPSDTDLVMVEVVADGLYYGGDLDKFKQIRTNERTIIQPANEPLPTLFEGERAKNNLYRLQGFITQDTKLISPDSQAQWLVDLVVAHKLSENRLERGLLISEVGSMSLIGSLSVNEDALSYLQYFDEQKGTDFVPSKDPYEVEEDYPAFTDGQYEQFRLIAEAAHSFMTKPRS
jgi:hypothetical protein